MSKKELSVILCLLFFTFTTIAAQAKPNKNNPVVLGKLINLSNTHRSALSALKLHAQQESSISNYNDWSAYRESSKEPVLTSLLKLGTDDSCQAFVTLSDQELLTMVDEIEIASQNQNFHCGKMLNGRIQSYYRQKKSILQATRTLKPVIQQCQSDSEISKTLGPSKVYEINPRADTSRLVYGPMKPCEINFTFDDGPHSTHTYELLKILDSEKVSANFFVVGNNVVTHQRIVQDTLNAGHYVGAHSQTHRQLSKLPFKDAVEDIEQSFLEIQKATNFTSIFFRFPYGSRTKNLRDYLVETGRVDFFWSMDSLDWKLKDPTALFQNVANEVNRERHGIILFHDVHLQTIAVMPEVFAALREAGYHTTLLLPTDK